MADRIIKPGYTFIDYIESLLTHIASDMGNNQKEPGDFAKKLLGLGPSASEKDIREACEDFGIFY